MRNNYINKYGVQYTSIRDNQYYLTCRIDADSDMIEGIKDNPTFNETMLDVMELDDKQNK